MNLFFALFSCSFSPSPGAIWGYDLAKFNPTEVFRYTIGIGLVGALAGLILTPYFTTRPARALRSLLGRIAAETLFAGLTGLVVGLLTAALLSFPLSLLPDPFGSILPFVALSCSATSGYRCL